MQLPTFDKLFAIHRCFSSNVPRTTDKFVSLDDICQSITSCKNSSQSHAQVMNFIQTNKQWEKLWTKMKFGPNQRRTFGADIHGFALFFLNLAGVQATTVRNQITQKKENKGPRPQTPKLRNPYPHETLIHYYKLNTTEARHIF